VNKQCDALDGVVDGVLTDPRRCNFDPSVLLCSGPESDSCLTSPQIDALKNIYAGPGKDIYPGLLPGGETGPGGWVAWLTGTSFNTPGSHLGLGIPFFKYFIFDNPDWDFRSLNFDTGPASNVTFTDNKLVNGVPMAQVINAVNPDLYPLQANGAKLIQYHGFSDSDISPLTSINYYTSVTNVMGKGAKGNGDGLRVTQDFYRLFMVPGMQHCAGGPGATTFDALTALENWVEQGTAPESILAAHVENGVTKFTRPLCPYPAQATYKGNGDTNDAANFVCK
jgi:feruloyl esterase